MWQDSVKAVLKWVNRVIHQPMSELTRWQRAAKFCYDLGRHGARQLKQDQAPQMAAALSFRALFGLIPVLVVATILVRAIIGVDEFVGGADRLLQASGLASIKIVPATAGETSPESVSLRQWIDGLIGQAASVNLTAVGWIGVLIIVYSAISLLVTIEECFNRIYRAPEGRPWSRRIPLYWFLLTVSPLAIVLVAYLHSYIDHWAFATGLPKWLLVVIELLWTSSIVWMLMLGVYMLVPNTTVSAKPAAAGAFVFVLLFAVGRQTLGAYLQNAFTISQLYGSLGLIPLFMFWVYLMWLALLFGLEVSAILQFLAGRQLKEVEERRPVAGAIDPLAVVTVAELIAANFRSGQATTVRTVAEKTHLTERVVHAVFDELVKAGFAHRVEADGPAVIIARPPEDIPPAELVDIGYRLADAGMTLPQSELTARLRAVQRQLAAELTLSPAGTAV